MRRHYVTHPRFQFWFIFSYVRGALIAIGGGALLLGVAVYFLAHDPAVTPEQSQRLLLALRPLSILFGGLAVIIALFFSVLGFYFSYKMAGPIRRIENWLVQKKTSEEVLPLHLRPGDEWIPVVELLNRLSENK